MGLWYQIYKKHTVDVVLLISGLYLRNAFQAVCPWKCAYLCPESSA